MNDQKTKFLNLFRLSEKFTEKELKEAYRDLAHVWHPDKHNHNERLRKKAEDQLKEINEGYEYLKQILKHGQTTTASYSKPNSEDSTSYKSESQNSTTGKMPDHKNEKNNEPKEEQSETKSSNSNSGCFIALAIVSLLFLFILSQWNNSNNTSESSSYSSYKAEREISKKLDEKNGFKQFQFLMSVSEAEKIQKPTQKDNIERNGTTFLFYENSGTMNIGEYPIDNVLLYFFNDSLYRIDITFSSYQSEIFQTFVLAFGQPYKNDTWTRGDQPLRAKSWEGNVVLCTILAPKNSLEDSGWDAIVIYDKDVYQQASEYEENEPIRASEMIHNNGLGDIKVNITLNEFTKLFNSSPHVVEAEFEQKTVYAKAPETFKIGYYPVDNIKGYFFKNKLYRFDVNFSKNRNELFKSFMSRFPNSTENNSWTQGKQKLTAMEFIEKDNVALILAPKSKVPQWETFIFYSIGLTEEKDKFEREAPKRAAGDI